MKTGAVRNKAMWAVIATAFLGFGFNFLQERIAPSYFAKTWDKPVPVSIETVRSECGSPVEVVRQKDGQFIVICPGYIPFTSRVWLVPTLPGWIGN